MLHVPFVRIVPPPSSFTSLSDSQEYAIPGPNCAMRPRSVTKCGRSHSGRTQRAVKWGRLPISGFRLFAGSFRREPISSPRRPWANQRQEGVIAMCPVGSQSSAARRLVENGPRELELLFRAIVYHPSVPILLADDEGNSRDASTGVGKLLGLPREKIIGRRVDDFAQPGFKPQISQLWKALQEQGEQEGTLGLVGRDGIPRDVQYTAKGNVLPVRHLVVLHDKTPPAKTGSVVHAETDRIPSWVQDYALFLMDVDGRIVTWYSGAERIYGYNSDEATGQHVSFLYPSEEVVRVNFEEKLKRAAAEGHLGNEGWHLRKDGSRFWANVITMALRDENGELQGFARVVRDFSERHEKDEKWRRSRARRRPVPSESTVAGIVSGEFDQVPEANDAFLEMVGYSREDLLAGRLHWRDLTPPEYAPLDDLAHEEGLRFGACTPFEKELIRKDGTRVPVLVATAVLKLSPFRWRTFVPDLRERDRLESIEDDEVAVKEAFGEIVGSSAALRRVQRQVEVVAPTD